MDVSPGLRISSAAGATGGSHEAFMYMSSDESISEGDGVPADFIVEDGIGSDSSIHTVSDPRTSDISLAARSGNTAQQRPNPRRTDSKQGKKTLKKPVLSHVHSMKPPGSGKFGTRKVDLSKFVP